MRIEDVFGNHYLVVVASYWRKYRHKAFVERICNTLEEANEVAAKCEYSDRVEYIVLWLENGIIKEVEL